MTFKTTSERLNHVARTGSASTRPHANGRIDLIPLDAQEPEDYYNTVKEQYLLLQAQYKDGQERLAELNKRLKETLPWREFEPLSRQRDDLRKAVTILQDKCSEQRVLVRRLGKDSWALAFYELARRLLDEEEFRRVEYQTIQIMGRPMTEIPAGEAEATPGSKETRRRAEKRQHRRKTFRERYFGSAVTTDKE